MSNKPTRGKENKEKKLPAAGMRQLAEQLKRQVVCVLLYSRPFSRVSRPALDVLATVLEAMVVSLWNRAARIAELSGVSSVALPVVLEELLRSSRSVYLKREELLEYGRRQLALEHSSVLEERGLVSPHLQLLTTTRVDPKLMSAICELEGREGDPPLT